MGCNCGSKKAKSYEVNRPGQPPRSVTTETAAQSLVKGVPGATYSPKGATK